MNIFIFRRDLRLVDNTSLIQQTIKYGEITPVFIFTPEQINPKKNKYFSSNAVQFMIESLESLNFQIKERNGLMNYFYATNLQVLQEIQLNHKIRSIGFNRDYTPYAKDRDQEIIQWATKQEIPVVAKEDYALYDLFEIDFMGRNGNAPTFTPFKEYVWKNHEVRKPNGLSKFSFLSKQKCEEFQKENRYKFDFDVRSKELYTFNPNLAVRGGRKAALEIIKNLKQFENYFESRNFQALPATKLSAYLHFTTVSIREVYQEVLEVFGINHHLVFELTTRQFFTYICHKFPDVLLGAKNLKPQFDHMKWRDSPKDLQQWKQGKTGVPFVDAGMREMNETGYMHNRTRQNVACFLVKDLLIDWRKGEEYFAEKLVDYSPTQNSGNWQYVAGVGTDPRENRIFNPWLQAEKYDPDCQYIRRWIPELKEVPVKDILQWQKSHDYYLKNGVNYFRSMVNHINATKQFIKAFQEVYSEGKPVKAKTRGKGSKNYKESKEGKFYHQMDKKIKYKPKE